MMSTTYSQNAAVEIDENELGMGILFDMVNIFTGDVLHKKRISESFLNLTALFEGGTFHGEQIDNWKDWAEYLIGFSVCAAIGIVFIIVMPIAGLILCCCRLCGRCGAKSEKSTSKRSKCKRRCYCTVLIILTTITLVGAICAFICNSIVYKHLQNNNNEGTLGNVNQAFHNIETYLNDSVSNFTHYVNYTYGKTSRDIVTKVNDSATNAVDLVIKQLNAEALLANATEISIEVNETKKELDEVGTLLSELSIATSQLRDNLTDISDNIQSACGNSSVNQGCSGYDKSKYDTNIDFSSLDSLSTEAKNVDKALDMYQYIAQANESLESAKKNAHDSVENKVKEAEKAVKDIQVQIDRGISDTQDKINDLLKIFPRTYDKVDSINEDVKKYSSYIYYGGIGLCSVYLLVVALYYVGLLFGVCGEKPGDGAPCCNTGCGAYFLLSGVGFTFIFSWILMIICVVLFCGGGPAFTEVCRYFQSHDPSQVKVFDGLIKEVLDLKSYYKEAPPEVSLSEILQNCQEDKALFSALQLDYLINLNKTFDLSELKTKLEDLKNANFHLDNITIINQELNKSLDSFANSGIDSVNFTKYFTELSKQLTKGNLSEMAFVVDSMALKETNNTLKQVFNDSAQRLRDLNNQSLPDIKDKVSELNATLTKLQQHSRIRVNVLRLIQNLKDTETNFNANKTKLVIAQIVDLVTGIIDLVSERIDTLKYEVRQTLSPCRRLATDLFTLSDTVCIQIVEPVNGFWFSFGWCLFFFVPCLIFAVLLADQYRRTLEDDKEFDDPNYMIYGNPNPDTIPLTRVDNSPASRGHPRSGMYNAGYRDEYKRSHYADPPPYDAHMQPGIAAYASPIDQRQRQGKAYPATHGDNIVTGTGAKSSYAYMY
ncbi:hypothetical protein BsWGS_06442 [Bradybaena similaris]